MENTKITLINGMSYYTDQHINWLENQINQNEFLSINIYDLGEILRDIETPIYDINKKTITINTKQILYLRDVNDLNFDIS